jgi:uncharacterized protein (DUF4415 family)
MRTSPAPTFPDWIDRPGNTPSSPLPEPKDRLTIRVDHDVVEWLKRAGSGYQTRINAILRSYMKVSWNRGSGPLA